MDYRFSNPRFRIFSIYSTNFTRFEEPAKEALGYMGAEYRAEVSNPLTTLDWSHLKPYAQRIGHRCHVARNIDEYLQCCRSRPFLRTFEATPSLYVRPSELHFFSKTAPSAKSIIMLRDPVEVAISLYNHWAVQDELPAGWGTLQSLAESFLDAMDSEPLRSINLGVQNATSLDQIEKAYQLFSREGLLLWGEGSDGKIIFTSGLYAYWLIALREVRHPSSIAILNSAFYYQQKQLFEFVFRYMANVGGTFFWPQGKRMCSAESLPSFNCSEMTKPKNQKVSIGKIDSRSRLSPTLVERLYKFYHYHNENLRLVMRDVPWGTVDGFCLDPILRPSIFC
jgi:hypothetical protein